MSEVESGTAQYTVGEPVSLGGGRWITPIIREQMGSGGNVITREDQPIRTVDVPGLIQKVRVVRQYVERGRSGKLPKGLDPAGDAGLLSASAGELWQLYDQLTRYWERHRKSSEFANRR